MNWDEVREVFVWDGSWLDIYVLDTSMNHWTRLLRAVSAWPYESRYFVGGVPTPLPRVAEEVFTPGYHGHFLELEVGGVRVNCHFFDAHEVEFDIDPREVKGPLELTALEGFMRRVGVAVERPVRMTPENASHVPIFTYSPAHDTFTYVPMGALG